MVPKDRLCDDNFVIWRTSTMTVLQNPSQKATVNEGQLYNCRGTQYCMTLMPLLRSCPPYFTRVMHSLPHLGRALTSSFTHRLTKCLLCVTSSSCATIIKEVRTLLYFVAVSFNIRSLLFQQSKARVNNPKTLLLRSY